MAQVRRQFAGAEAVPPGWRDARGTNREKRCALGRIGEVDICEHDVNEAVQWIAEVLADADAD